MGQAKLSVSIVVPVYNVSLYIERCVKSVMAQTYPVKECIIVDDASPDDSIAKCMRLIAGYDGPIRFVVLHHNRNRGLSAARNTGTDAAQGDYIFYLDSDDELTPDSIEMLAIPIERNPSIEMVQGNHLVFSENPSTGNITIEEDVASSKAVREFYFDKKALPVMAWNKLISREFLMDNGLCFMGGILFEDVPWTYYVVKYLQHLYVIREITYHYHVRPLSIWTGASEREKAEFFGIIYEDIARHFTPGEEAREAKFYFNTYFSFFIRNRGMESFKRALPFFEKALVGNDCRREQRLLWVVRLSSKSAFMNRMFVALLRIRTLLLHPFHRLASFRNKVRLYVG